MKMIHILFLLALLSSTSHAFVNDFCAVDLKAPDTPLGYNCKPISAVTVDDFVFSSFEAGNTTNTFNATLTSVFVTDFPSVNGLGISTARLDIAKGGSIPMHTYPGAIELLIMVKGQVTIGFMTPTALYSKTIKPGDIMVFPQGKLHFQVNSGNGKATAFLVFSSANLGAQLLDLLLFGNGLSSEIVATTFVDVGQEKKPKAHRN